MFFEDKENAMAAAASPAAGAGSAETGGPVVISQDGKTVHIKAQGHIITAVGGLCCIKNFNLHRKRLCEWSEVWVPEGRVRDAPFFEEATYPFKVNFSIQVSREQFVNQCVKTTDPAHMKITFLNLSVDYIAPLITWKGNTLEDEWSRTAFSTSMMPHKERAGFFSNFHGVFLLCLYDRMRSSRRHNDYLADVVDPKPVVANWPHPNFARLFVACLRVLHHDIPWRRDTWTYELMYRGYIRLCHILDKQLSDPSLKMDKVRAEMPNLPTLIEWLGTCQSDKAELRRALKSLYDYTHLQKSARQYYTPASTTTSDTPGVPHHNLLPDALTVSELKALLLLLSRTTQTQTQTSEKKDEKTSNVVAVVVSEPVVQQQQEKQPQAPQEEQQQQNNEMPVVSVKKGEKEDGEIDEEEEEQPNTKTQRPVKSVTKTKVKAPTFDLQCKTCHLFLEDKPHYQQHRHKAHEMGTGGICPYCQIPFRHVHDYNEHIQLVHLELTEVKLERFGYAFRKFTTIEPPNEEGQKELTVHLQTLRQNKDVPSGGKRKPNKATAEPQSKRTRR